MILDLGRFTRRGLMVDWVIPAKNLGETKHRKSKGCKTRKEAVEDRETNDLSVTAK